MEEMERRRLTLREALASDQLDAFVQQEEAFGVELANGSDFERALALLITQRLTRKGTGRSRTRSVFWRVSLRHAPRRGVSRLHLLRNGTQRIPDLGSVPHACCLRCDDAKPPKAPTEADALPCFNE
jgi:hypothetical protein